jgi:hypothetical protein
MVTKALLPAEELARQTAIELPERETPATVVLGCLAVCVGSITINNVTVLVGAQICAVANIIAAILGRATGTQGGTLTCTLTL